MTSRFPAFVQRFLDLGSSADAAAFADMLDPEVVWYGTRGGLDESQVLRGPEAVVAYMREIQEPWAEFDVEVERVLEAGDKVVVFMLETGRARHGGPELRNETAMNFKLKGERVVEIIGYLNRDEAMRAAGVA